MRNKIKLLMLLLVALIVTYILNKPMSEMIAEEQISYSSVNNEVFNLNFGGSGTDYFNSIIETSDGYIAVGGSNSTDGDLSVLNKGMDDAIIVKYDFEGNKIWNKNFGGSNYEYFESITETSDGYIVVGYSKSTDGNLNGLNKGNGDGIVIKYDFDGNIIWNKNFGGSRYERFYSIIETSDGFIAVGKSDSSNSDLTGLNKGVDDAIIVKFDFEGNKVWNKNFGGSNSEFFKYVTKTSDGFIAVGYSFSTAVDLSGLNKGDLDGIITKLKDNNISPDVNSEAVPKEWTNENVTLNVTGNSKYGIHHIRDFYDKYTYSNSGSYTIKENGKYKFIVQDKNLSQKVVEVEVNNIDRVKPNKPNIIEKDGAFEPSPPARILHL